MQPTRYTVIPIPDEQDGGYVALVPAIPGCVTQGDTLDEAIAMAQDAAEGMLMVMAEHGKPLPTEPDGAVVARVEVAAPTFVPA